MLKTVQKFIIDLIDYIAPKRIDALLVKNINKEDIFKLPKGYDVQNFDWIHPLFHYKNNKVRAIIWELKYRENTSVLDYIGKMFYEEIIALISDVQLFDSDAKFLLIPIPISKERRIDRGFNQSEYIAKSILQYDTEHILIYAPQYLLKILETPKQSRSQTKVDRMKNLIGCFSSDPRIDNSYVILIDDVVTTGSTLSEARSTVLSVGARDVFAFTIAH